MNREWIAQRIPHQGNMCLLDEVSAWSADHIECRASSHTDTAHPLRAAGRLGAATFTEPMTAIIALAVGWGVIMPALMWLSDRFDGITPKGTPA